MKFSEYLLLMINKNKKKQKEIICDLNLKYKKLNSLDEVTFSRWINSKTSPSLEKQLLIAHYLEKGAIKFIKNIDIPKNKKAVEVAKKDAFMKINNKYHDIYYSKPLKKEESLHLINVNKNMHIPSLEFFYNPSNLHRLLLSHKENSNITVLAIKDKCSFIGHLTLIRKIHNAHLFLKATNIKPNEDSILIDFGYFPDESTFSLLIGHMFSHLMSEKLKNHDVYIMLRGKNFINLLEKLGGILITAIKEDNYGNIFILKFNFINLLSEPFILKKVQLYYERHNELKEKLKIKI